MHFPVDPNKRDGLWDKLETSLSTEDNCFVVSGGVFNANAKSSKLSVRDANEVVTKLKGSDYVRVGVSRNQPLPAHFSLVLESDSSATVVDYIAMANQSGGSVTREKIKKDACLIADTVFYDCPDIKIIHFPIKLGSEVIDIYEFQDKNEHTVIRKVS
jgi:hypothetical protein